MPVLPRLFRRRKTSFPIPMSMTTDVRSETELSTANTQRTYLPDAVYVLPKDAQEDDRLRFQHYALYHALGNHYLAPVSAHTRTILDVGTGTGAWPMDITHQFPGAQVIGVDLTLTSLPDSLPRTCLFSQADILQGLPFPNQQFDFTHQRLLVLGIPASRWPKVVRELVRVTSEQGWIELLEVGITIQNAGPATARLLSWLEELAQNLEIDFSVVTRLGQLLEQAGCQAVQAYDIPVPLGSWAGRAGEMLKLDVQRVMQALQPRSSLTIDEVETMVREATGEWEKNRACYVFHTAYGRVAPL